MKKNLLLLIFLLVFNTLNAQWIFQHIYGTNHHERCQSAFPTRDGGFLLNGASTAFGTGDVDALIIKVDLQGNILWAKSCGTPGIHDIPTFTAETFDNKFIFVGTIGPTPVGSPTNAMLFKTDSLGNFLWAKEFGGTALESATKLIELPDHGYGFTGTTNGSGAGNSDIFFIRTDQDGDTIFTRVYGTSDDEKGTSIATTSDGGFIITGKTAGVIDSAYVFRAVLIRVDSTGNLLWSKIYGDTVFQEAQSAAQTADGGFIVCGSRNFGDVDDYDILLFKTDGSGNIQWSKTYGGSNPKGDASYTVNLNSDGSYVLSGYTNSMGFGHQVRGDDSTNAFLMKTDANGDTLWTRAYGDSLQEEGFLSAKTLDGGYIISGFSDYHNSDSLQMIVIKTDSLGHSGCNEFTSHPDILSDLLYQSDSTFQQVSGMSVNSVTLTSMSRIITDSTYCLFTGIHETPDANSFNLFPNPTTGKLFIQTLTSDWSIFNLNEALVTVYNMLGEKINVSALPNNQLNYFELNVSGLKQGIYLLEISTENGRFVKRFIKE